jgi:cytochrome c
MFVAGLCAGVLGLAASGVAVAQSAGDAKRGADVFRAQCSTCHAVDAGKSSPIGPHLFGVVGRKAATAEGFKYSPAFEQLDFAWTQSALNEYLENPQAVAPGTPKALVVPNARNRADVIAFLATLK